MIRQEIKGLLKDAIWQAQEDKVLPLFELGDIVVEKPEDKKRGDYSSNIAMKIAGLIQKPPLELAEIIVKEARELSDDPPHMFEKIEAVAPGFINFFLAQDHLQKQIAIVLENKEKFGQVDIGKNQKVQVEFISANPTGPLTLGNGRGGFFGDALANILAKVGYDVTREYFINDSGHQIEVLGHSVLKDDQAQYKGDYIELLNKKFTGFLRPKDPKKVGEKAAQYILEKMIKPTITDRMKITFNSWVSEKELHRLGETKKMIDILKNKDLVYENEGALWFRSSKFGDDKDRVLITSEKALKKEEETYFLADATYHYRKFVKNKFDKVIDIWGADHYGYAGRLKAFKEALDIKGDLKIIIMQLVRLFESGREVKMSKRSGDYITIDELLSEIPLDVARFFFLMHSPNTHMDFDLDLAKEQSAKNPVYYVQYAYARISSIISKANKQNQKIKTLNQDLHLLNSPTELNLIKSIIRFPEIIEDIVLDYQVHRLCQFVLDLVGGFHKFYEECRVISDDKNLSQARLALTEATRVVLKNSLDLMGISAPEKM